MFAQISRFFISMLAAAVLMCHFSFVPQVHAQQSDTTSVEWQVLVDGEPHEIEENLNPQLDPPEAARRVLSSLHEQGYYLARLDSVAVDSTATPPTGMLYVNRGREVRLGSIQFEGAAVFEADQLRAEMQLAEGDAFEEGALEADIDRLLDLYEREGFPLVQIEVGETRFEDEEPILHLTLQIEEGEALRFERFELGEGARSNPALVAHLAGLRAGETLGDYDPEVLRQQLETSELFESVGTPEIEVDDDRAIIHLPVEEAAPGIFDLVVGYQPDAAGGGRFVGGGHLMLRNLFGGGRQLSLELDQRAGAVSEFAASVEDPFVLQTPFSGSLHFEGRQQDSTYHRQRFGGSAGYSLGDDFDVHVSLQREVTQPGVAGVQFSGNRQRVARTSINRFGAGFEWTRVDRPVMPRSGFRLELSGSGGQQNRALSRQTTGGDTIRVSETFWQERIEGRARGYLPIALRHTAVVGGEASAVFSDELDEGDLLQIGGAKTLRGYDEDQFRGSMVGRLFAEYRYFLDPEAYAFAFADLGHIRQSEASDAQTLARNWWPGFGAGLQLQTRLGLFTLSYAINDRDDLMDGRIHMQLSVGL